jgi:hypothetical protein
MKLIAAAIDRLNACTFPAIAIEPRSPGNSAAVINDPEFPTKEYAERSRLTERRAATIPEVRATITGQRDDSFQFALGTGLSADS